MAKKKMKLREITLDRVRKAYAATGLTPGCGEGSYGHKRVGTKACALEALGRELGVRWIKVLGEGPLTSGFYHGFDDLKFIHGIDLTAFRLGRKIRHGLGLRRKIGGIGA